MKTLFLLAFLVFSPLFSWADTLYEATIKTADNSKSSWEKSVKEAASVVLTKVSGNATVTSIPTVKNELNTLSEAVNQFSYEEKDDALFLKVQFDSGYIDKILLNNGQAVWSSKRPTTIVWLRLTNNDPKKFNILIQDSGKKRGLKFITPLYDIDDLKALSQSNESLEEIINTSHRYQADNILIGTETDHHIDWHLQIGENVTRWQSQSNQIQETAPAIINNVADFYANQYAQYSHDITHDSVYLEISNIYNYQQYAKILKKLEVLQDIDRIEISQYQRNHLLLKITVKNGLQHFSETLRAKRQFILNTGASYFSKSDLSYQWISELKSTL